MRSHESIGRAEDIARQGQAALEAAKADARHIQKVQETIANIERAYPGKTFRSPKVISDLRILHNELDAAIERSETITKRMDEALQANNELFSSQKWADYAKGIKEVAKVLDDAAEAAEGLSDNEKKVRDLMGNPLASTQQIIELQESLENASIEKKRQDDAKSTAEEIKRITEDSMPPLEAFQTHVKRVQDLADQGLIDPHVLGNAISKYRQEYMDALNRDNVIHHDLVAKDFRFTTDSMTNSQQDDLARRTESNTARATDALDQILQIQKGSQNTVVELPQ
jgi:hypothetical protein